MSGVFHLKDSVIGSLVVVEVHHPSLFHQRAHVAREARLLAGRIDRIEVEGWRAEDHERAPSEAAVRGSQ